MLLILIMTIKPKENINIGLLELIVANILSSGMTSLIWRWYIKKTVKIKFTLKTKLTFVNPHFIIYICNIKKEVLYGSPNNFVMFNSCRTYTIFI